MIITEILDFAKFAGLGGNLIKWGLLLRNGIFGEMSGIFLQCGESGILQKNIALCASKGGQRAQYCITSYS